MQEVALNVNPPGFSRLAAVFKANREREMHVKRKQQGLSIVCPFLKSSPPVVEAMLILAKICADDIVFDLGCGIGSILITVAEKTGAKCFGFDIDPILCATARRFIRDKGLDDFVVIEERDIMTVDLSLPTVFVIFLVPSCLQVLSPMFQTQCKKGTKIVCYKFPLPASDGWVPEAVLQTEDVLRISHHPDALDSVFSYIL